MLAKLRNKPLKSRKNICNFTKWFTIFMTVLLVGISPVLFPEVVWLENIGPFGLMSIALFPGILLGMAAKASVECTLNVPYEGPPAILGM